MIAPLAYGALAAWAYFMGRNVYDSHRFGTAENKVREQFDLDPYPTKYSEYPEGYAQALEKEFRAIKAPSWLFKHSLDKIIKETYENTRKRPIDDPLGL